jgi:acyl-CoA thioester hydrolase
MWYTGKFDEASWALLATVGLTRSFMAGRGHGMAAVQQNIIYKRELRAGDIVSVRSGILDVQEKIIRIFHEMRNEETFEVSAFATITGVYMDIKKRRASPIPVELADHIKTLTLDENKLYWTDTLPSIPKPHSLA